MGIYLACLFLNGRSADAGDDPNEVHTVIADDSAAAIAKTQSEWIDKATPSLFTHQADHVVLYECSPINRWP